MDTLGTSKDLWPGRKMHDVTFWKPLWISGALGTCTSPRPLGDTGQICGKSQETRQVAPMASNPAARGQRCPGSPDEIPQPHSDGYYYDYY